MKPFGFGFRVVPGLDTASRKDIEFTLLNLSATGLWRKGWPSGMESVMAGTMKLRVPVTIDEIREEALSMAVPGAAAALQKFFKTGPGEYADGDIFLGIRVPDTRKLAKSCREISLRLVAELLDSRFHEERLLALIIMNHKMGKASAEERKEVYDLYMRSVGRVDNWDLVDASAEHVVGSYLYDRDRAPIHALASSDHLWSRRIALISTFYFIKRGEYDDTFSMAERLLGDREDLIQKAAGWMLREIGNRDRRAEEAFLRRHYKIMPRTMLRYAIEKFDEPLRQDYLKGRV